MRTIQDFALHDITIRLACPARQNARVVALWQQLFVLSPGVQQPTLCFTFAEQRSETSSVAASPVYQSSDLSVLRTPNGFHLRCGQANLVLDLKTNSARGFLHDSFWECGLQDQREFFLLALLMLLHRQHCFGLHANGLVHNDKGFLLVGESGRGKTTLTLTLIAQGWGYLGDDAVLLRSSAAGVMAQALRLGFACTPETLARFPMLQEEGSVHFPFGAGKWLLPADSFYPHQFQACCMPQVLLFPTIEQRPCSELVPLSQAKALFLLTQQSAGILTDADVARQQIAVLKQLVQQTRCYQLLTGQDVFTDVTAVADLLAQA